MLPSGSILFSSRAPIGHSAVNPFPVCTNQGFKSVVPGGRLDPIYGFFALKFLTATLVAQGRGATFAEISKEMMEAVRIPYRDLPEQKRIATLLEQADDLRRARRYAQRLTDSFLLEAYLALFGDPKSNPHKWPMTTLGEQVKAFTGGVNFNPVSENQPASSWRVLKISAVTWGEFRSKDSKPIGPYETFRDSLIISEGDLLMSRANTTELVGAVARVREVPPRVLLPDKIWRIELNPDATINPDYLLYCLRTPESRRQIAALATGTSGSMKNISKDDAGSLPIPVPPAPLQDRFCSLVNEHECFSAKQREALRQAERLLDSLLIRNFGVQQPSSQLLVTQGGAR
jgi:type I restriction enzyme, S subunit